MIVEHFDKIDVLNYTYTMKKFLFVLLCVLSPMVFISAQSAETIEDKSEMRVVGDPGKGPFFVHFNLPQDFKKVVWTVTDEKGKVLIKEKYKNLKAGKNKIEYNYLYGPDGKHTFTITADESFTTSTQVVKKRKK